jgi:hypothetical protein
MTSDGGEWLHIREFSHLHEERVSAFREGRRCFLHFAYARSLRAAFAVLLFPMLVPSARADVTVYVGYAENERTPIFFPNPWVGSPKTRFLGHTGPDFDTGAILIRNNGPGDVTLGPGAYVDGFTDGAKFQLWDGLIGTGVTFPPGENVILAATASSNFDTSDHPIQLTPDLSKPVIHLTINGQAQTFIDSSQVLNTGGFDLGNALGRNESLQWRPVGTTGILFPGGTGNSEDRRRDPPQ